MADNVGYTPGSGALVASDEATYSGDTTKIQLVKPVLVTGTEGSKTVIELTGDATNGLDVDVTRVSGTVTVGQATAANLNATVTGTVTANAGTGNFTVTQATAANLNTTTVLAAGTAYAGRVRITDGTNDLSVDTLHSDGESATENHLDVAAKAMGLNSAGTFDIQRVNTTTFKCAQYTTAQTGVAIWTPASGKAVCVTYVQIQSYATTAGTAQLWFGASADTTYTRGTDAPIFDGEFAPTTTNKPGVIIQPHIALRGTVDYVLRLTTTGAQSITVTVWGYEI